MKFNVHAGYHNTCENDLSVSSWCPMSMCWFSLFLFVRNVTFHYKRSSLSYFGGVCSVTRGVGVNEVIFFTTDIK